MDAAASIILIAIGLCLFWISLVFGVPSFSRYEIRAGFFGLAVSILGLALIAAAVIPWPGKTALAGLVLALIAAFGILLMLPNSSPEKINQRPSAKVDERTIMFSRNRLKSGTPHYEEYYAGHPEHKVVDDEIRNLPGLLSPHAPMAEPRMFAAADAAFFLTDSLRDAVDGPIARSRQIISPENAARYVKHLGKYFGARNTGICQVRDYHIYSHIGRGTGVYGAPIVLDHPFAVVFTFEMSEEMVRMAPRAPEVMETARQYSESAQTAIQAAAWIRSLGYEARAHIDGNYRLILPLVGRDAGLGEIGRMGLLMTPELGPRVRLSAVSTTMPLMCDLPGDNASVIDFCKICRKCAENCPGQAIPFEDRQMMDGALRWKINAEGCFRYWNMVGTDCGKCMAVCPYSHANDSAHNMVRWLVGRSWAAGRVALKMDDWLYGRRPKPRPGPDWTNEFGGR